MAASVRARSLVVLLRSDVAAIGTHDPQVDVGFDVTERLIGFEFPRVDGQLRELRVKRRGRTECEAIELGASGELFELEEEIAQTVAAFRARRALVSGVEARKSIVVCLGADRALRGGRDASGYAGRTRMWSFAVEEAN